MSLNNLIKDDTLEKLKCDFCHNYLSYFPICMSNDRNICGRSDLHPQQESKLMVNKIFEAVAESIEFPCQYKEEGCSKEYFPKDIIEHEKTCSFRTVKCPASHISACNWEGALPIVLIHCQNKHYDLMLNEGNFEFNLAESHQRENLLEHASALFLVSQNFTSLNNKLMKINIRYPYYVYDIKDDHWKIIFETTNRELNIRIDTQAFENHKNIMIYFDSFVSDADSHEIEVKGKIMVDKKSENKSELSKEKNDEFLALLKCSSCSNYALPPIYEITLSNSQTKKNIQCSECRSKVKYSTDQGVRNDTLDRLAEKLTFPCENQVNGCTFKSKFLYARNHRLSCSYRGYDCPVSEFVSCNWKGFGYDIPNHLEQIHSDLILKTAALLSKKLTYSQSSRRLVLTENKITCHIIRFLNRYFRLNFFQNGEEFHWVVQLIGPEDNNNYYYEIEIVNTEIKDNRLIARLDCKKLMKKEDLLKTEYCYFHCNQIKDITGLLSPHPLMFKVKVFK